MMFFILFILCKEVHAFQQVRKKSSFRVRRRAEPERVEVCLNKHCKKRGSQRILNLFEALIQENSRYTQVCKADMSHTEHGCFDECTMGPNVRLNGIPQTDQGRVINNVKTPQDVANLLGIKITEDWTLPCSSEK